MLVDESLTETLRTIPLPLEGKLVSLLSLLEDKLNQLDSVVRQVDGFGRTVSASASASLDTQLSDQQTSESHLEDHCRKLENTLFEETNKLNDLKAELTTAREGIKIAQAEKEKILGILKVLPPEKVQRRATLVSHVDKIQIALQERLEEAQSVATEALNTKLECDRLREELTAAEDALEELKRQQRVKTITTNPSSRPTSRSAKARPVMRSQDSKRPSLRETSIQEDSNDDAGFMTPTGGGSSLFSPNASDRGPPNSDGDGTDLNGESNLILQQSSSPSPHPPSAAQPSRPKAKKQYSELNSDSFGFQSPLQLGRKVSKPITPKTVGDSEIYQIDDEVSEVTAAEREGDMNRHRQDHAQGEDDQDDYQDPPEGEDKSPAATSTLIASSPAAAAGAKSLSSKHGSNQSLGPKSVASMQSDGNGSNSNNQSLGPGGTGATSSYFSSKRMSVTHSDQSLSKIESPRELLRMIETKLAATHQLLTELQSRKEQSRSEIEKWTLFFLREYGRVPGLAESKYGPSNQLFETFNKLQHEIYSCHYEVQELFDHLDSRRQEILTLQNSNANASASSSFEAKIEELDDLFQDPLLSQHEGEEYEDAYKLHFDSVETMLLQMNTDSEEASIHSSLSLTSGITGGGGGIFPHGLMSYDPLDDLSKVDVLQNIDNDIKEFQQDLDELKHALHESREVAEQLNNKIKIQKREIQKWYRGFMQSHGGKEPMAEDKEREVGELYSACHEAHSLLEDELEKMKTYALISSAKSTEIERLKAIFRKFLRISSPEVATQFQGMATMVSHPPAAMSSHNSSVSLQSSQSLFQSLSDRLGSVVEERKDTKTHQQGAGGGAGRGSSSMESDSINSSTYPPVSETPQQDLVKLTDDLEMLRAYFTAAENDLKELKDRKAEIKHLMKSWEEEFIQTNLRKPTSQERKTLMEDMYEEYQAIQEEITEILEQREKGLKMKVKIEYLLNLRMKQLASGTSL